MGGATDFYDDLTVKGLAQFCRLGHSLLAYLPPGPL